ncbi:MAG: type IV pilus modification PilV family protein [Fimbriimonas sp.]
MMRTRRVRSRGFTWIEVLLSIFVVGITAAIYGSLIPMSAKTQTMAANHQQALGIIQHKIDQLRAVGYGRLTFTELKDAGIIDSSPTSSPFRFDTVDNLDSLYISSVGTIAVSDFSTTVRQVTVTLTWTGSGRRQGNGTASLTALVAKG